MDTDLKTKSHELRLEAFEAISNAGGGHYGGTLSEIELLTVLFFRELRIDPSRPHWADRDRFILSKGHGGPGLYTVLADRGFFEKKLLDELDQNGSRLPKHINRLKLPGIDVSSGSLGQGLSVGVGMAASVKMEEKNIRVYVLMGDGECDEGQIWEAAMTASKYHLDNLVGIVDNNGVQVDGTADEIMPTAPLKNKWESFGWNAVVVDGHDVSRIASAFDTARVTKGKPTVIIANTVKGKGVSFMEDRCEWHSGKLTACQYTRGRSELEGEIENG